MLTAEQLDNAAKILFKRQRLNVSWENADERVNHIFRGDAFTVAKYIINLHDASGGAVWRSLESPDRDSENGGARHETNT